jgi:hypothetical protein
MEQFAPKKELLKEVWLYLYPELLRNSKVSIKLVTPLLFGRREDGSSSE